MTSFVIIHPILVICLILLPLLGILILVWRSKPSTRGIATAVGFCWAFTGSSYWTYSRANFGNLLDRKIFVYFPVASILTDISHSADIGNLELTKCQLDVFQQNWNKIIMTRQDPWPIQESIKAMETNKLLHSTTNEPLIADPLAIPER